MIKIMNGISAIEWDSGGCKLVLQLSFDWINKYGMFKRHFHVKIGDGRVQIFVGSPTGRVEAVPV